MPSAKPLDGKHEASHRESQIADTQERWAELVLHFCVTGRELDALEESINFLDCCALIVDSRLPSRHEQLQPNEPRRRRTVGRQHFAGNRLDSAPVGGEIRPPSLEFVNV